MNTSLSGGGIWQPKGELRRGESGSVWVLSLGFWPFCCKLILWYLSRYPIHSVNSWQTWANSSENTSSPLLLELK